MSIPDRAVYATQPIPLRRQIERLLSQIEPDAVEGEVLAVVAPNTNLLKGGSVAASVYKPLEMRKFDTVIVIAPSHEGTFGRINIASVDAYHTPLGALKINDSVRNELCDEDDDIYVGDTGHFHTEGIDVQLPFLQTVLGDFNLVPIVMGEESPDLCRELGYAVGEIMYNRPTLLVATADIINFEDGSLARFREYFEAGDVSRLMALLNGSEMQVEGKGPVLVALIAAMHRRANRAHILRMEMPEGPRRGFFGAVLSRV